jgi:hypothetical protein
MNYKKIYDAIVFKAKARINGEGYYENHHIIPKSLGGNDDADNLVFLTAREHFICHWLLTKFVDKNHKFKMAAAFNIMCVGNTDERKINSHSFRYARENWSREFKLNHHSKCPEFRNQQSTTMKEYYNLNPQTRKLICYDVRICSCGCGGTFITDTKRTQEFLHGHRIFDKKIEEKRSASVKQSLNKLSKSELSERSKNSFGSCDHVERGKKISEGKKGKKSNQKEIMGAKFSGMTDAEFQAYIIEKQYSDRMITRFTGYRNSYVDK